MFSMCDCTKLCCGKCNRTRYNKVTHVIFDMDGTLMNSEELYQDIISQICKKYGKEYPPDMKQSLYGCTDREICETIIKELKISVPVEQLEKEMGDALAVKLPNVQLQPGVERLIKHLRDNKIPIAVATNSLARDVSIHVTSKAEFFANFHHMVTADDVGSDKGKPHPDIYLEAAARFSEKPKPDKCLVFEDSGTGLAAARAAGMQVVFTPYSTSQRSFGKAATIVLKNLFEFRPEGFGLPRFTDDLVQDPNNPHKHNHANTDDKT